MSRWREICFSRFGALLLVLLAMAVWGGVRWYRSGEGERSLERTARQFLEAGDAGDFGACRKLTGIDELRFRVYCKNREALGALRSRELRRREPLRFGERTGWICFFDSAFEAAELSEVIAVLAAPEKPAEVFSVRFEYPRLPRPKPTILYTGRDLAEIKEGAARAAGAFDAGEWKYFEGIARREIGYARSGAGRPLAAFQQKFGKPVNRAPFVSIRWQEPLPGCLNLGIVRVDNRVTYTVRRQTWQAEESIWLVRDRLEREPKWEVYAYTPGRPVRQRQPKPAVRRPAAGRPAKTAAPAEK